MNEWIGGFLLDLCDIYLQGCEAMDLHVEMRIFCCMVVDLFKPGTFPALLGSLSVQFTCIYSLFSCFFVFIFRMKQFSNLLELWSMNVYSMPNLLGWPALQES